MEISKEKQEEKNGKRKLNIVSVIIIFIVILLVILFKYLPTKSAKEILNENNKNTELEAAMNSIKVESGEIFLPCIYGEINPTDKETMKDLHEWKINIIERFKQKNPSMKIIHSQIEQFPLKNNGDIIVSLVTGMWVEYEPKEK